MKRSRLIILPSSEELGFTLGGLVDFRTEIPAHRRVIIMGSGIHHAIFFVIIREISVINRAIKGEKQDFHSRIPQSISQRFYLRGNNPQILGDNTHWPKPALHFLKKTKSLGQTPNDR